AAAIAGGIVDATCVATRVVNCGLDVLELHTARGAHGADLDAPSCTPANRVDRRESAVFSDDLEPRPRRWIEMKAGAALRAAKPNVVDSVHVRSERIGGHAAAELLEPEGTGVFEGVDVEAEALAVDLPGHEAADQEIPNLSLADLNVNVVGVD